MRKDSRLELRLTEEDEALLDAKRGPLTRSAWLRHAIRNFDKDTVKVALTTYHPPKEYDPRTEETIDIPTPEVVTIPGNPKIVTPHRHKGEVVAERTIKGVTTVTLKCTEPGCTRTWER